jgi:hypothetical protein
LDYARFPKAETFNDVMEQLDALASQDHEYMTVVIDTIDLLERLIHEAVVAEYNAEKGKNIKSIGDRGFGAGYVKAMEQWEEVLTALDFLRNKKDMMCILLAHSLIKTFSPPDSDSYDRYRFNMHDKSSERIKDWADVVIFGNYKVTTKGEKDERKRAVGAGIRAIHTEERPAHWGKNRYSLPYEIPFTEGKQWSSFADLVWPHGDIVDEVEGAFLIKSQYCFYKQYFQVPPVTGEKTGNFLKGESMSYLAMIDQHIDMNGKRTKFLKEKGEQIRRVAKAELCYHDPKASFYIEGEMKDCSCDCCFLRKDLD